MSRQNIIAEACGHLGAGAHYIKRGFGHKFTPAGVRIDDVVEGREAAVSLAIPGRSLGLPPGVVFVARSQEGGIRVCAGRSFLFDRRATGMRTGDPDNPDHRRAPELYLWRRPLNFANATEAARSGRPPPRNVIGECCVMKRHFDCIGFVSYCFWKVMGYPPGAGFISIENWKDNFTTPVAPLTALQPGDILFSSENSSLAPYNYRERTRPTPPGTFTHIGIALSATQVVHAAGCELGVMVTEIANPILPNGDAMHWEPEGGRPRCFA
jgi:cell wall-associated NlpC family hydrolase